MKRQIYQSLAVIIMLFCYIALFTSECVRSQALYGMAYKNVILKFKDILTIFSGKPSSSKLSCNNIAVLLHIIGYN